MSISKLIRDPAWQFVGVVIALLGLIVTIWPSIDLSKDEPSVTLCNLKQFQIFSADPAPPEVKDRLFLTYRGNEIPLTELSVTQFCLSNKTGRTIENSDFIRPLTFELAEGAEIIYIRNFRQEHTTAVASEWHQVDTSRWEMTPTFLNANETLWIQAVYRIKETIEKNNPEEVFKWQALFKGASFKLSPQPEKQHVWYSLKVSHEGLGLYLLIGTGLLFSFISLSLYQRFRSPARFGGNQIITSVILTSASWATAEIIIDFTYNGRENQPTIGFLFVISLAIAAIFSTYIAGKPPTRRKL